ncbi:IS3 family transposase [Comamonas sp. GB3 AK4-5]|uniref:IS3 family transposase n=1 Tax=Comamonas sp. GB3 AK4-5 TaxID=3231487 RepID=UPI00351F42A7
MYSYADRIRVVELYIKLGLRVRATIRQLGYPTKNALKGWYQHYLKHQDLPASQAPRAPKYSLQQRQVAVAHYLAHDRCIAATMRALGYPGRGTLTAWVRQDCPDTCKSIAGRSWLATKPDALMCEGVVQLCTRQSTAQEIADNFGVCRGTLYNWKNQLLGPCAPASMKHSPKRSPVLDEAALRRQVESLRQDVRRLKIERELLKQAHEILRNGSDIDLHRLTNKDKVVLVEALRGQYKLPELLSLVGLARSSYFYRRARLKLTEKYLDVRRSITDIFDNNYRCYGYRRVQASLLKECTGISEKVVRRLMKQEGLIVAKPKRRRYNSYLGEIGAAPQNLINRDFHAAAPNEKWLTDITEFQIPAGKVYLSPVIDCFDGLVVSWSIGPHPNANLVNTMLDAAIDAVQGSESRPVIHSDRGAHYRWPGWLSRVHDAKLVRSMSRKGCSPDNAACEGFFGRLKMELFYPGNWQSTTIEQFIEAVDTYIRWYNEKRIKVSLGRLSPVEYRHKLGLAA